MPTVKMTVEEKTTDEMTTIYKMIVDTMSSVKLTVFRLSDYSQNDKYKQKECRSNAFSPNDCRDDRRQNDRQL